ncbi:MAG: tRNA (adenosine(37)-N6)-dimethylallyltransferase MiaA [bacterium]
MYIIVTGATGTGKSAVAVELAKKINGEIISADSMQVYVGMDIGTYKISKEDTQGISHHLLDVVNPWEKFSVAQFKILAEKALNHIKGKGKIPIVVGGTGLFINSLTRGILTSKEPSNELKSLLRVELEENGLEALVNLLNKKDPEAASLIDINNSRRVLRALELIETNKMSLSELRKTTEKNRYKDDYKLFVLETGREYMYSRLDKRVDEMIKSGLLNEVKVLMSKINALSMTSMQAIGYKETTEFLNGNINMNQMIINIKQATRNYAKRQLTWFKKYEEAIRINMERITPVEAAKEIQDKL